MDYISRRPEDLLKLADLHPELAQWLQARPQPPPPQDLSGMRTSYEKINQHYCDVLTAELTTSITVDDNFVTARDGYQIPIRVYRSASSHILSPLIIAIHGGAKTMGSLTDEDAHCRIFAAKFNATCVNIGYRLAPEHKSPVMVHDCWNVVQWAARNASTIGADPKKGFIIQGSSAGAQMADVMGHLSRDQKLDPPVTGLLEICTSSCQYDAMPDEYKSEFLSWDQDIKGGVSKEGLLRFFQLTGVAQNPTDPLNSPLLWPGGHKGMPPVFFQVHGRDFVRDSALIYEKVLREQGLETKLMVYPGVPHGFNVMFCDTEVAKQHEQDTLKGIEWLLSLASTQ